MPFWFLDKENDIPGIFGSLRAIAQCTDIEESTLYNHYSNPIGHKKMNKVKLNIKRINKHLLNSNIIKPTVLKGVFEFNKDYDNIKLIALEDGIKNKHGTISSITDINMRKYISMAIRILEDDIKNFEYTKEYPISYVDDKYIIHKKDIKRTK